MSRDQFLEAEVGGSDLRALDARTVTSGSTVWKAWPWPEGRRLINWCFVREGWSPARGIRGDGIAPVSRTVWGYKSRPCLEYTISIIIINYFNKAIELEPDCAFIIRIKVFVNSIFSGHYKSFQSSIQRYALSNYQVPTTKLFNWLQTFMRHTIRRVCIYLSRAYTKLAKRHEESIWHSREQFSWIKRII